MDNRIKLVAIDDEPEMLRFLQEALAQESLAISTSTNPETGLQMVAQQNPEIVMTDLTMPKMTGLEVLERVLQRNPETEVILMTGNYSIESAVEAIQKGACDYLEKP